MHDENKAYITLNDNTSSTDRDAHVKDRFDSPRSGRQLVSEGPELPPHSARVSRNRSGKSGGGKKGAGISETHPPSPFRRGAED